MKGLIKEKSNRRNQNSVLSLKTFWNCFIIAWCRRFAPAAAHTAQGPEHPGAVSGPQLSPPLLGYLTPSRQGKRCPSLLFPSCKSGYFVFSLDFQASCVKDTVAKLYKLQLLKEKTFSNHFIGVMLSILHWAFLKDQIWCGCRKKHPSLYTYIVGFRMTHLGSWGGKGKYTNKATITVLGPKYKSMCQLLQPS